VPSGERDGSVQLKGTLLNQLGSNGNLYCDRTTQSLNTSNLVASASVVPSSTVRAQSVAAPGSTTARNGSVSNLTTSGLTASVASVTTLNCSSTTLSGSGGSSGGSPSSLGYARFSWSAGSSQINTSSASNPYSATFKVNFNTQEVNTVTGLSSPGNGTFSTPVPGTYHTPALVKWGNWGSGWRVVWIVSDFLFPQKLGETWSSVQNVSGGGSPFTCCSAVLDLRSTSAGNRTFSVRTSHTPGTQNASTTVGAGSTVTIVRLA
jgi:hypothetical protein